MGKLRFDKKVGMDKWVFDEKVASNFDYIADTSIPKYRVILHKMIDIIKDRDSDTKIIDIGCATGNTLDLLRKHGFTNIYGVDNSKAMIEEAGKKGHRALYVSDTFPFGLGSFDVIIANWTLHFIEPKKRIEYIDHIFNFLNNDGVFVLSEKVEEDQSEYLNFKRANFLTEDEIKAKSEALKGVLITKPISWYEDVLSKFGNVEIIDHTYCFVTFKVTK